MLDQPLKHFTHSSNNTVYFAKVITSLRLVTLEFHGDNHGLL